MGNASFELIAGDAEHLGFDRFERLPFTLTDFYREELEEMAIVIRRRRSFPFRMIEQAAGDIEANGACTRRRTCGCVGGAHAGRINERRRVGRETTRIPWCVARVGAEECDGRLGHRRRITRAEGNFEEIATRDSDRGARSGRTGGANQRGEPAEEGG